MKLDWLMWLVSPLGVWLLAFLLNTIWYLMPKLRAQLGAQTRSWVHLALLALPSCVFFWWLYQGLSLFFYGAFFDSFLSQQFSVGQFLASGAARLYSYFQTTGILLRDVLEPLEYYILTAPLLVHVILVSYATCSFIFEHLMTWLYLRQFQQTFLANITILETKQNLAFTSGFLRPQIYISRQIWESEWQEAIVQHEQKHWQRFDPLRLGLARFFYRLTLFYPFATWLWQQYQLEIERLCDQQAARSVGMKRYTNVLLDYAGLRQKTIPTVSSFSSPTMLEQRLEFLLHRQMYSKTTIIGVIFGLLVFIALMIWGRANSGVFPTEDQSITPLPASSFGRMGLRTIELESKRTFVLQVINNSLAGKAGLQVGDEILSLCGQNPKNFKKSWATCEYELERSLPKYRFKVHMNPNR